MASSYDLEKLVSRLREVFSRVLHERQNGYYMVLALKNSRGYIICLQIKRDYVYAKVNSVEETLFWNCLYSIEDPRGYYVFSRDMDSFIEKLLSRIKV